MRATEFIRELFQPGKKNWEWDFRGSEEVSATFMVVGIPYRFYAGTDSYGAPGTWEVEFSSRPTTGDFRGHPRAKFGLTGTGNATEVMSTVSDIMREFLQQYQGAVDSLVFSAAEPSRQALYKRMIQRLLPNWDMKTIDAGTRDMRFVVYAPKRSVDEASKLAQPRSAGCIIVAEDTGRLCLQQRSDTVSDPGVWSTWGGGVNPGETLEDAVRRELAEEGGYRGDIVLELLHKTPAYATFIGRVPHEFKPQINHESKSWCWAEADQLPEPIHPGLTEALSMLNENFADGKVRGKSSPGRVKRAGASCAGSVTDLRARAKRYGGERGKMYHWCANMKSGRKK